MLPALVSVSDFLAYVSDPDGDAGEAGRLLAAVEQRLAADCGRADHPFEASEAGRVEVHDGTGSSTLYLHYPITTLTSVTLGYDVAAPDETLDITDLDVLIYQVGRRRLVRRDGGVFGLRGAPAYIRVTYTTADDLPTDAQQAVLEMAAALWRGRGSEGVRSERLGSYSVEFGALTETLPNWRAAVSAHGVLV